MSNDKNTPPGAPSDDTTSALFVSARKKQLEEQEAARRAKEKEEQRLAAEAEVQRLEREVEERRRRAEEDKRLAEEEARRIAEEARVKKAMAESDPNAFLGVQPLPMKPPAQKAQGVPGAASASAPGTLVSGLLKNKKMLMIAGGAAAVVIVLVVTLVLVLGGGGSVKVDPGLELSSFYDNYGISLKYPENWHVFVDEDSLRVYVQSDYDHNGHCDTLMFTDVTWEYIGYIYDGTDPILAGVWILEDSIREFIGDGTFEEYQINSLMVTNDGWLAGGIDVPCTTGGGAALNLYIDFRQSNDQLLLAVIGIPERKRGVEDALTLCRRIAATAELEYSPAYEDQAYSEPQVYYDLNTGIYFEYPDGWYVMQASGASTFYAPVLIKQSADALDRMIVYNYTPEFNDFVQSGNSGMDNLIDDFAYWFLEDAGYDYYDVYNVEFSDRIAIGAHEVILLEMENDEAYFYFCLIKILSEPQQVAAIVLETKSIEARDDFDLVMNTLEIG